MFIISKIAKLKSILQKIAREIILLSYQIEDVNIEKIGIEWETIVDTNKIYDFNELKKEVSNFLNETGNNLDAKNINDIIIDIGNNLYKYNFRTTEEILNTNIDKQDKIDIFSYIIDKLVILQYCFGLFNSEGIQSRVQKYPFPQISAEWNWVLVAHKLGC